MVCRFGVCILAHSCTYVHFPGEYVLRFQEIPKGSVAQKILSHTMSHKKAPPAHRPGAVAGGGGGSHGEPPGQPHSGSTELLEGLPPRLPPPLAPGTQDLGHSEHLFGPKKHG